MTKTGRVLKLDEVKLTKSGTDATSVIEYHLSQLGIKINDQNIFSLPQSGGFMLTYLKRTAYTLKT